MLHEKRAVFYIVPFVVLYSLRTAYAAPIISPDANLPHNIRIMIDGVCAVLRIVRID
jgi:hypothetical protein